MPGWRTTAMLQSNPTCPEKIKKNIGDIKTLIGPEDTLLDVGCYHGHMKNWLGHPHYTGTDLFQEHIDEARKQNPGEYFAGDLFKLEGKWDVVVCSRVLMHIPDYEKAVDRLRACCRKFVAVFIPIGQDVMDVQEQRDGKLYFRSFPMERIAATSPEKLIKHEKYSTVIYGPNLP